MREHDDWSTWANYVLEELNRLAGNQEKIFSELAQVKQNKELVECIQKLREDVAVLKVKSGIWGFLAGLIVAVAMWLYEKLKKG